MFAFLDLPAEIRARVYDFALSQPTPIIVYAGHVDEFFLNWDDLAKNHGRSYRLLTRDYHKIVQSVEEFSLGLLRTSRLVGAEASSVFYAQDALSFDQYHEWTPVVSWLTSIGARNTSLLTRLSFYVSIPSRAWQCESGKRNALMDGFPPADFRRLSIFAQPSTYEEGHVDVVDAVIEDIFHLLGSSRGKSPIRMLFKLPFAVLPGIREDDSWESYTSHHTWFGMDTVHAQEFESLCSFPKTHRKLQVSWDASSSREHMELLMYERRLPGWNITSQEALGADSGRRRYSLKRDAIVRPLVPDCVNPHIP
ncbi:Hypothetical protein D9617_21g096610 [Elsinoe fawcettii]|nr:Hypothetical protein D9617_21g096610 [Elsinoe fawcettii]